MIDILRPYLSRILASLFAGLVTWLAAKGIVVDADTVGKLTDAGLTILFVVFNVLYAVLHRTLDKKLNPGDAASSHLAVEEKAITKNIKAVQRSTRRPVQHGGA